MPLQLLHPLALERGPSRRSLSPSSFPVQPLGWLGAVLLASALLLPVVCVVLGADAPPAGTVDMAAPAAPDMAPAVMLGPAEIPLKVAQRCPGDPSCPDTGDDVLYVGVAKRDVTAQVEPFTDTNKNNLWDPGEPFTDTNKNGKFAAYWLAGYGNGRLALGIHDPVWARALALKQNQTTVVLVAVGSLGLFAEETTEVEKLIEKKYGKSLGIDLLLVHGTHVHQSDDPVGAWGPDPFTYGVHEEQRARRQQLMADAVAEAVQMVKPARLTIGAVAVEDPGHDLSRFVSDTRDPVVIDNVMHTFQFVELGTTPPRPIATLVNWAFHPEAAGSSNHLITSDFVHYLREGLEAKGTGTVVYVSGPLGGQIGPGRVQPVDGVGQVIKSKGFPFIEALGKSLVPFALGAMADPAAKTVEGKDFKLSFRTAKVAAQIANKAYQAAFQFKIYRRTLCCYDDTRPVSDDNLPSVETLTTYLRLGPASIITNPGELLPELFLGGYKGEYAGKYPFIDMTKENAPDPTQAPKPPYLVDIMDGDRAHRMTFGLTMDFLGYIVPRYNWVLHAKMPYFEEANGDHYEETNSIGPLAEPQIVGTMRQLVLDGRPNVAR